MVSGDLVSLRGNIPSSFACKPRTLFELDRWKATELRQFLHYTGPVVLPKVSSKEMFFHFSSFNLSTSISINDDVDARKGMLDFAATLLNYFVYFLCNAHNLKHIVNDAKLFNCSLDGLSWFMMVYKFENYSQSLERIVKNVNNPLVQICKRLH